MLSDAAGAPHMLESYYTQEKQDAKVRLYRGAKLRKMFPWLNPDGIELASYSLGMVLLCIIFDGNKLVAKLISSPFRQ